MRLTLTFLVAQSSALALQPAHAHGAAAVRTAAAVRSAAAVRTAAAMMCDSSSEWASPELLARLKAPIRQFDGGWADTAGRYGGKKDTNINGEKIKSGAHYGTGGGERLDSDVGALGGATGSEPTLPPEKQEQCVLPEESWKVEKMAVSQTDEDLVIECDLSSGETEAEMFIDIEPMFLTKTEYFYGFTADSTPKIRIDHSMSSDIEGEMNAKDFDAARGSSTLGSMEKGADRRRIMIKLKFDPEFEAGEFDAYLCFIFPTEKPFSRFYKITGKSSS